MENQKKVVVQKFGGTSVGTVERILQVAQHVITARNQGYQVIVVVSAMQGETDRLIQMAKQITHFPNPREYDRLVSTGECVSTALLAIALKEAGIDACSLTGADAQIFTNDCYQNAAITEVKTDNLKALLAAGKVPIVAGFQGVTATSEITTLGRGGSDTTAVAIAAAMHAAECQIFTDVDGVYTSDPRVVSDAKLLEQITYSEMLALSTLGAKVLHRQSVAFAKKCGVPVRVLSTFSNGVGTLVSNHKAVKVPWVSGVAFEHSQAKLTILGVPKKPDYLSQLRQSMSQIAFDIDMFVENYSTSPDSVDFSFTVHLDDYPMAIIFANELAKSLSAKTVIAKEDIAKLSLVGIGMSAHAGVASKVLQTLSEKGIAIYLIASTEAKISTVIDKVHMTLGAKLLHDAFALGAAAKAQ